MKTLVIMLITICAFAVNTIDEKFGETDQTIQQKPVMIQKDLPENVMQKIILEEGLDNKSWWIKTNGKVKLEQLKFNNKLKSTMYIALYLSDGKRIDYKLPLASPISVSGTFQLMVYINEQKNKSPLFLNTISTKNNHAQNSSLKFKGNRDEKIEFSCSASAS